MKIEPIPNEPALLLDGKKKILIVADLHIGIEAELRESGINIPSQTEKMAEHLLKLCKENHIHDLVIVGDLKHNVPMTSRQEYFEIPRIFERLREHVETAHITLGNHDGNLKNYLPSWVKVHDSKGFTSKGIGFFHGHTWPKKEVMSCKQVVCAHQHPTILFVETLGERDTRRCWVKADFITKVADKHYPGSNPKLILMPAFNGLLGGTAVNDKNSELLGPIMKNNLVDMMNAEIYLLDGTFLGKLTDLRV